MSHNKDIAEHYNRLLEINSSRATLAKARAKDCDLINKRAKFKNERARTKASKLAEEKSARGMHDLLNQSRIKSLIGSDLAILDPDHPMYSHIKKVNRLLNEPKKS